MAIVKGTQDTWWDQSDRDIGPTVAAIGQRLWDLDSTRRADVELSLRRFGGKMLRGLFLGREQLFDRANLRLNITKSVTESLTSKVGKNRPRPFVLTDGANWSLRARGKKLQRFLDGAYQSAEVYSKIPLIFRDALLMGTGIAHFFPLYGKMQIGLERVFPLEILVDPVESVNGEPRAIFRHKIIDRFVLANGHPKMRKAIEAAPGVPLDELPFYGEETRGNPNMIRVVEAWYLADYAMDGTLIPGKHVLAVSNATLHVEDYEEDYFPFEFYHWTAPVRGFWGDSAVAEIRGIEKEVNTLLQSAQKAMKLAGNPWLLIPNSTKLKTEKMTNEAGLVVRFEGLTEPKIVSHQPQHPQILQQAWMLKAQAFEILGTNESQASGTKPPGIDSGRALEQLSEEHLARFETQSRAFEDQVGRRYARQILRVANELDEHAKSIGKEGYVVRAVANKTTLKIKWSEAKLSPDDFFMQTFPTSILPHLPSGRTEEVERWQANGWVTAPQARALLDFPDLASNGDVAQADQDLLEWQLEQMLEEGKDIVPEPRQNLQSALQWGTYSLEKGLTDGTPPEHLEKLRTYLNAIDDMQKQAKDEATAQSQLATQQQPPGMLPVPPQPGMPPAVPGVPGMPPA